MRRRAPHVHQAMVEGEEALLGRKGPSGGVADSNSKRLASEEQRELVECKQMLRLGPGEVPEPEVMGGDKGAVGRLFKQLAKVINAKGPHALH